MLFAFARLLLIAISALLCLFLAIFGLRFLGEAQRYSEFNHPLVTTHPWIIADGGNLDAGPKQSLVALKSAAESSPEIFLALTIRISHDDEKWVLFDHKQSRENMLAFEDALKALPNARFYIIIDQPGGNKLDDIFTLIKNFQLEDSVVLTSPFADTLREIRNKSARWLTGASTSEATKAQFMTSLFLETMVDLPGDVFIVEKFRPRLFTELSRRKKVLIFKTDDPTALARVRSEFSQVGVLTTRPSLFGK
ncbi:MAG: hypothetical protein A2Z20_02735 [Bdellovibrionales bacterium RBG_16_40_8]|nr:MAG: hypothetical protein A2Z20_02735 [Bdellovibrionales bacterium RBG_16_40_8]